MISSNLLAEQTKQYRDDIPAFFTNYQLFPCEGENIPVAKQQSMVVFQKGCDINLSMITLHCPRPPLQTCSGYVGGTA